ncbi:alpha/beta fold hydrolase [Paenibacillus filicis]|uniref:Alpha/beta fold hydrolase n=1 Tax=Paenibacillus gyeongsangnamensis TaxID=3388067 RepID=A0ABT4QAY2_9BACL|nr:alpha/beta fold hydrolase [Paenibacillus filicis]MCZ8513936.1 alpha/beta fold hydrolase [Paenibacillus filicis]
MTRLYKSTEPFVFEGAGETASTELLMIHGFTGSPSEFRRLGYYMNDLGYTVRAVLLPGHGTTPEDMIRTGWDDWWGHVLDTYDAIRDRERKRIIAVGHSMGGLLALKLSMDRKLDGVISLASPVFLTSRKTILAVLLQFFIKYVDKKPTAAAHLLEEACTYEKAPLPCVVALRKLLKLVKSSLNQVKAPVMVAQGERDGLVLPRSAEYIYGHVSSPFRELAYYPKTSHAILLDEERDQVYEDIHRFILKLEQLGAWEQAAAACSP